MNAPSLQLAKADNGPWVVGQGNAAYQLTVTNASTTAATTGSVTVLDTLPGASRRTGAARSRVATGAAPTPRRTSPARAQSALRRRAPA
ncbi:hypothetical protein [Diaphorobacter aerolatus]|uniref:DUF11 domain-containing protein n=1 Tax=Diaphorobacter aerolatus TaxID=1288495 RepID=A0A7H0GN69_9BURK|nr:hypothetical protein [Diaphorobacter aerolatus]QNP49732.1 hypothetical protein H9K75_07355 [Diaphorobacter aerolatus]QNP49735.1 hypothetical protein H9K75_07370 [Diaphorobacter aerolatus]